MTGRALNVLLAASMIGAMTGGEYMSMASGGTCESCADYDFIAGGCFDTGKPVHPCDKACKRYKNFMDLPDEPNEEKGL